MLACCSTSATPSATVTERCSPALQATLVNTMAIERSATAS